MIEITDETDIWKRPMKHVYVRRMKRVGNDIVELGVVDIPENHIEATLKRNPLWEIVDEREKPNEIEPPAIEPTFTCPLCGKETRTENGLKIHKTTLHP